VARVRFAPSPTGSLHVGSALTAVANRRFADEHGGVFVLRIDDTDEARTEADAEAGILRDLEWLGVGWDEGPVRQSERGELYAAAAQRLLEAGEAEREPDGAVRFRAERRPTLLRADGRATYQLASVVDDVDLGITHVIRGTDHLENSALHASLTRALGAEPPEYMHHGLLLGPDGTKLSKRHGAVSLVDLRERGIPAEAVRAYLEELGLPKHDVHYDEKRLRRLAVEALGSLTDEELAERAGAPVAFAPALRGARDLVEARALADLVGSAPAPHPTESPETLRRFAELRTAAPDTVDLDTAHDLLVELRTGGADLKALRLALTGEPRGPELQAVVAALPRDEALRRAAAASNP
jgi:glutamyl-tRNA synthetase